MISILVPFLNEEDSILDTILRIQKFTEHSNNLDFEIILIDDGSTDDSLGKIESEKWSINLK